MDKEGKINIHSIKLIGATLGAIGFYLIAFDFKIIGAILIGLGGILLAIGN
ncbi:hypothetical protein J4443_00055 [Candidatus Woesearchaeota archaeon]|nr:hypothetical protein [Candidatus Woesearchaeota archaeon]